MKCEFVLSKICTLFERVKETNVHSFQFGCSGRKNSLLNSFLVMFVFICNPVYAQLLIDDVNSGVVSVEGVIDKLLGVENDAVVSNVSFIGDSQCLGVFTGGSGLGEGALGFDAGVMLGTGAVLDAVGPNISDETTSEFFFPGDSFLSSLVFGDETFDACVLEFDFSCDGAESVSVDYVMASEEYNEFIEEGANDVFGFELNGTNISLIPDSGGLPVSIANLNCGNPFDPNSPGSPFSPFCDLFINNDLQDGGGLIDIEADGLTTVLRAESSLNTGTNHMKFAVGDVLDYAFDTWVFLKAGSFKCSQSETPPTFLPLLSPTCTVWDDSSYYANEDIVSYDEENDQITKIFDGSDVGLAQANMDAFSKTDSGIIFFSLTGSFNVAGIGTVRDEDIIKFTPSSLGDNTDGTFELYFDGSLNGMGDCGDDIDAFHIDEGVLVGTDDDGDGILNENDSCPLDADNDIDGDGLCGNVKLYFSLTSSVELDGVWYADEDVILFDEATGTFTKHLDGSDVGISHADIDAIRINDDQSILFSLKCSTTVQGFGSVADEDVVLFTPTTLGESTSGSFSLSIDGSGIGLNSSSLDFNGLDQTLQIN